MDAGLTEYAIDEVYAAFEGNTPDDVLRTPRFWRQSVTLFDGARVLLDTFPDIEGASCCFVRWAHGSDRDIRLVVRGVNQLESCPAGGWLLKHSESRLLCYWLPQLPTIRTVDPNGRILSQEQAPVVGMQASASGLSVDLHLPPDTHLDLVLWRLQGEAAGIREMLERPLVIERQPVFLRSSHSAYRGPADLYRCLVHGHIYDDRFVWRRQWGGFRWRICSENEAYSLYHAVNGLELATGRGFYSLLKRQILFSVVARQSEDGGWHHGEWTDLMESHFRLHSAGIQILEAALEEQSDGVVSSALERAVSFLVARTDETDVGSWFLHDALEESVEKARVKGAPRWTPNRILGGSITNKLILNTHLDAVVALTRYARLTGDTRHDRKIASARAAAQAVLQMRPAEWLYRIIYRAVWLTLLPNAKATTLPLAKRAMRRLAREHLTPRLHYLKRAFPRFVMPGGLIDRHLSPMYFDRNYHTVNLMDVVRFWRCYPEANLAAVVEGAVKAVVETGLLDYWMEGKQKQPLGYWIDALYELATLGDSSTYRRYLADAILRAEDVAIGLSPSLLGANVEAVRRDEQIPCPSPTDCRLRVANLSRGGKQEVLVVNPTGAAIDLVWQTTPVWPLVWEDVAGDMVADVEMPPRIPPRSWVLGRGRAATALRAGAMPNAALHDGFVG